MNKKYIIISVIILIVITLSFAGEAFAPKKLDISTKRYKVDRKKFSMYVENDLGKYEEYTESEFFPEGYTLNMEKSNCVDSKDNILTDIITSNNNQITVTSNKTIYCYLYFDMNVYDIQVNLLLNRNNNYVSINETPTTDLNYNYTVRYDCDNNVGIKKFSYNYETHKYKLVSSTKNKCNIYFDEMIPDIKIIIYINNVLTEEIPSSGSYTLNEVKSSCTNSSAEISYNNETKKIKVKSNKTTECTIYLEGA